MSKIDLKSRAKLDGYLLYLNSLEARNVAKTLAKLAETDSKFHAELVKEWEKVKK